jgi:predicted aconitase
MNNHETALRKMREPITRDKFTTMIQKWVIADSQLKILGDKTKQIRDIKQQLTEDICKYAGDNNIHKKIQISDGKNFAYMKRKECSTLSFSDLEDCLEKVIRKYRDHIDYILQYIKDNREIETVFDIRRTTRK